LCEKPLAISAAEVRQLAEIARISGVFLMEAMWMKFNPLIALVRELISAGEIGEVRSVRASFGAPFPHDESSRWKPGGSALLDQGIYPVTLSHLLLGVPTDIQATGVVRADGVDLSEHFTLEYPGGRFAQGASSMVEYLETSATVAGDRAWLAIGPGFWHSSSLTIHSYTPSGPESRSFDVAREGHGYVPMLRAVTEAIAGGSTQHPLHTHDDTAAIFDIMDQIRLHISRGA
jgi:predicted dehydrogenase